MDELDKALIEDSVALQKASFGDVSWDVFSLSIVWHKVRKTLNFMERIHFINCWSK